MSDKNQHWGSTLDDFLHEEGIYEAAKAKAVTRVISWQIAEEMRKKASRKRKWPSVCTQAAPRLTVSSKQTETLPLRRFNAPPPLSGASFALNWFKTGERPETPGRAGS